jgi:hypothetical protein
VFSLLYSEHSFRGGSEARQLHCVSSMMLFIVNLEHHLEIGDEDWEQCYSLLCSGSLDLNELCR